MNDLKKYSLFYSCFQIRPSHGLIRKRAGLCILFVCLVTAILGCGAGPKSQSAVSSSAGSAENISGKALSVETSRETKSEKGAGTGTVTGTGTRVGTGTTLSNGSGKGTKTESGADTKSSPSPSPNPSPNSSPNPSPKTTAKPVEVSKEHKAQVTLSIDGDAHHGHILPEAAIAFKEGDTVLDLLKRVTREKKIQMEFSGRGSIAYVEGIDNLYEFDLGTESGWLYSVNGKIQNKSAGSYIVSNGDVIKWMYTLKVDSRE